MLQIVDMMYSYTDYNTVLEDVNLNFEKGKLYAILGQSGCGKTTMLSLLGGLDSPRKGKILYDGTDIKEYGLDKHRKDHVAFIFQGYNLIEYMTVKENVELTAKLPVEEALEKVGLSRELWNRNVLKLSGKARTKSCHCKRACKQQAGHSGRRKLNPMCLLYIAYIQ